MIIPTREDILEVMKSLNNFELDGGWLVSGVACKELGRKFIGIEIEPKYFEIAKRRIQNTVELML